MAYDARNLTFISITLFYTRTTIPSLTQIHPTMETNVVVCKVAKFLNETHSMQTKDSMMATFHQTIIISIYRKIPSLPLYLSDV